MIGDILPALPGLGWYRAGTRPPAPEPRVAAADVAELEHELWAMPPARLGALLAGLPRLCGQPVRAARDAMARCALAHGVLGSTPAPSRPPRGIGIVPVVGVILPTHSGLARLLGLPTPGGIARAVWALLADRDVSAIVLEIDSPGGVSTGLPELAAELRRAGARKPITAAVNYLAAGSAYWLAASAGDIVISPSAEAGGLGIVAQHTDYSRALEQEGVRVSLMHAGERKVDGNPYQPLSERARGDIQARVNEVYGWMVADVAAGRKVSAAEVRAGFGQGRLVGAPDAVRLGLADRVEPFDAALGRLAAGGRTPPANRGRSVPARMAAMSGLLDLRRRRARLSARRDDERRTALLLAEREPRALPAASLALARRALAWCTTDLALSLPAPRYFDSSYAPLAAGFYQAGEIWIAHGLLYGPPHELVTTVCHEARHAWQAERWSTDRHANVYESEADAAAYAARVAAHIR